MKKIYPFGPLVDFHGRVFKNVERTKKSQRHIRHRDFSLPLLLIKSSSIFI